MATPIGTLEIWSCKEADLGQNRGPNYSRAVPRPSQKVWRDMPHPLVGDRETSPHLLGLASRRPLVGRRGSDFLCAFAQNHVMWCRLVANFGDEVGTTPEQPGPRLWPMSGSSRTPTLADAWPQPSPYGKYNRSVLAIDTCIPASVVVDAAKLCHEGLCTAQHH